MEIRKYLKNNIIITDGAMGTYYSSKYKEESTICEKSNLNAPERIEKIHAEYLNAGAKLIRTNTFSANTKTLKADFDTVKNIIIEGCKTAKKAVGNKDAYIAASIGPIPENLYEHSYGDTDNEIIDEYESIADIFISQGIDIFVFETFGSPFKIIKTAEYIKSKNKDIFVTAQFAFDENGYTRKEISIKTIAEYMRKSKAVDAWGLNCGIGPLHMLKLIKQIDMKEDEIITALPNAGYPRIENERTIYPGNPEYFADIIKEIIQKGVLIAGGCCGTTPYHIQKINQIVRDEKRTKSIYVKEIEKEKKQVTTKAKNNFYKKLIGNKLVKLVEIDPPVNTDMSKLLKSAKKASAFADAVTIADSPLGKARSDSIITALMIKRTYNIDVIPHICCRDKNTLGLKAGILGAYIEGIRNILAVTGDPLPSQDRILTKSVFDLNSKGLIELIESMNREMFNDSPVITGAAVNVNAVNFDAELKKAGKKIRAGARFFLTQPVFTRKAAENTMRMKNLWDVKVIAGIMPLLNYRNAKFLNNEVPGISIPDEYIEMLKNDKDINENHRTGIKIAVDCAKKVINDIDGFYFMPPFNRIDMIESIIKELKI